VDVDALTVAPPTPDTSVNDATKTPSAHALWRVSDITETPNSRPLVGVNDATKTPSAHALWRVSDITETPPCASVLVLTASDGWICTETILRETCDNATKSGNARPRPGQAITGSRGGWRRIGLFLTPTTR
jgi:hypothetical protein